MSDSENKKKKPTKKFYSEDGVRYDDRIKHNKVTEEVTGQKKEFVKKDNYK